MKIEGQDDRARDISAVPGSLDSVQGVDNRQGVDNQGMDNPNLVIKSANVAI